MKIKDSKSITEKNARSYGCSKSTQKYIYNPVKESHPSQEHL